MSRAIRAGLPNEKVRETIVTVNDLNFVACQACGEDPSPAFCFFDDDLTTVYRELERCDCLLFGSPVFFDAVSAQAKAFIDRCNCIRPPDYRATVSEYNFVKRLTRKRPGAMALVGGEQGWFEGARRCIAGFFKWVEVVNEGTVTYRSPDFRRSGQVKADVAALAEAEKTGVHLAKLLRTQYARR